MAALATTTVIIYAVEGTQVLATRHSSVASLVALLSLAVQSYAQQERTILTCYYSVLPHGS